MHRSAAANHRVVQVTTYKSSLYWATDINVELRKVTTETFLWALYAWILPLWVPESVMDCRRGSSLPGEVVSLSLVACALSHSAGYKCNVALNAGPKRTLFALLVIESAHIQVPGHEAINILRLGNAGTHIHMCEGSIIESARCSWFMICSSAHVFVCAYVQISVCSCMCWSVPVINGTSVCNTQ